MSKGITVKVAKADLIRELKKARDKRLKDKSDYDKAVKDWNDNKKKYDLEFAKLVFAGKVKTDELSVNIGNTYDRLDSRRYVTINFYTRHDLSKLEKPKELPNSWSINNDIEDLDQAIKLLELSLDDTVSTSSYKSLLKFL